MKEDKPVTKRKGKRTLKWSKEEDDRIFSLCKNQGTSWSSIASNFPGRTENQVKNRFYSTLRRVATKKIANERLPYKSSIQMGKSELLRYIDDALEYGRDCYSQRGRKKKMKYNKINNQHKKPTEQIPQKIKVESLPSMSTVLKAIEKPVTQPKSNELQDVIIPYQELGVSPFPSLTRSQPFLLNPSMHYHPPMQQFIPQITFVNPQFSINYQSHCQIYNQQEKDCRKESTFHGNERERCNGRSTTLNNWFMNGRKYY